MVLTQFRAVRIRHILLMKTLEDSQDEDTLSHALQSQVDLNGTVCRSLLQLRVGEYIAVKNVGTLEQFTLAWSAVGLQLSGVM